MEDAISTYKKPKEIILKPQKTIEGEEILCSYRNVIVTISRIIVGKQQINIDLIRQIEKTEHCCSSCLELKGKNGQNIVIRGNKKTINFFYKIINHSNYHIKTNG